MIIFAGMKVLNILSNRYRLSTVIIAAVVALLVHFPEVLSLSDRFEQHELFLGMTLADVIDEVLFTFVSLLLLFQINTWLFRFNDPAVRITSRKLILSFVLSWLLSSLLGKLFVLLHRTFDIPAIDAMVHHYLHPLRDCIMSGIVTGGSYMIHLTLKQQQTAIENQRLRAESISNQYEALKNQLNPHMLFNSLNTLQSLIRETPCRALDYTQELSRVLRYTLQSNESRLVALREEIEFSQAYIFLLKMRYEEHLSFEIATDERLAGYLLPPMSLQLLIENAIKHNEISTLKPLVINIRTEEESLLVSNPIQPKFTGSTGTGIGLDNLSRRYQLLMRRDVEITTDGDCFRVRLPLLKSDVL